MKILFLLLSVSLACVAVSPPAVESPAEETGIPAAKSTATEELDELPTEEPTDEAFSTEAPLASTPTLLVPDFAEILQFGGGGGGPVVCERYSSDPGSILIEDQGILDRLTLCVFLDGVQTADPLLITMEHFDTPEMFLVSNELILDRGAHRVYWSGYAEEGSIETWTEAGAVKFALPLWWPNSMPYGYWRIIISQEGGPSAVSDITYTPPDPESWIQVLDFRAEQKALPISSETSWQPMQPGGDGTLRFSGGNYPPNVPVYVLLYQGAGGDATLVEKQALHSNHLGDISGELAGPFVVGSSYLLYGITDPRMELSHPDIPTCYTLLGNGIGSACDEFYAISEPVLTSYSTTVPSSCPGAPPQQMIRSQRGYVCTQSEMVNLRDSPSRSSNLIIQLEPGTQFTVDEYETACADNWSWWHVTVDTNTLADLSGWLAEGGDATDPYFICPLP